MYSISVTVRLVACFVKYLCAAEAAFRATQPKVATKQYFKILISHNRRVFLALSLLQCQSLPISFLLAVKRENVAYIVKLSL